MDDKSYFKSTVAEHLLFAVFTLLSHVCSRVIADASNCYTDLHSSKIVFLIVVVFIDNLKAIL